jgi:hypothetical protein
MPLKKAHSKPFPSCGNLFSRREKHKRKCVATIQRCFLIPLTTNPIHVPIWQKNSVSTHRRSRLPQKDVHWAALREPKGGLVANAAHVRYLFPAGEFPETNGLGHKATAIKTGGNCQRTSAIMVDLSKTHPNLFPSRPFDKIGCSVAETVGLGSSIVSSLSFYTRLHSLCTLRLLILDNTKTPEKRTQRLPFSAMFPTRRPQFPGKPPSHPLHCTVFPRP